MYISEKIVEIGACLYGYYDNSSGIMNSPFTMKRYDGVEAFEEAEAFFKQKQQYDIANKIHDEKIFLIAQNSIKARKAGIYHLIPKEYRMSFFVTKRKLKVIGGIDWYEYFMYQFFPKLINFEARLRKMKRILTRTNH